MATTILMSWRKNGNHSFLFLRRYSKETLPFQDKLDSWWYLKSSFLITLVGGCSKLLIGFGNNLKIYNHEALTKYLYHRPNNAPLLTASNHTSMFDDPGLISNLVPYKFLLASRKMRWSLAAKEICFEKAFYSYVSSHAKVFPVVRGDGIYQVAMNYALSKLNNGEWVHIFPQAKITLEPVRLKWGIGRLIGECNRQLILLPFWHCGMEDFLPCQTPYIPRLRKKITVLFGEPLNYQHIIEKHGGHGNEMVVRRELTNLLQETLYKLKAEAELLHASR